MYVAGRLERSTTPSQNVRVRESYMSKSGMPCNLAALRHHGPPKHVCLSHGCVRVLLGGVGVSSIKGMHRREEGGGRREEGGGRRKEVGGEIRSGRRRGGRVKGMG